jgi:hypothetical protein
MGSRFWGWRQTGGGGAPIEGTAALQAIEEFEPVEIYTREAIVTGAVAAHGERMSDMLNRDGQLRVKGAHVEPLGDGEEARIVDEQTWLAIDPEEILFVMTPAHLSNPQRRVHRRQRRVLLRTGDFEIVGQMHVLPGVELSPFALTSHLHFMPVTNAAVHSTIDPFWERSAPVILVNVRPLDGLREVLTLS